jgi:peptide/nickel transport system ATP-binding protein
MNSALLEVRNLNKIYQLSRPDWLSKPNTLQALTDVNFTLEAGRSLGIVGESGSGKSTLARLIMALDRPTSGQVLFQGADIHALPHREVMRLRPHFQMVFQDPYGSLDPRQSVFNIVTEPLHQTSVDQEHLDQKRLRFRAEAALDEVGLHSSDLDKYPHEFSGGQRQRIAIARALITRPSLIVADEPVSALDVSVQAQVLNLMQDLQEAHGLTYVWISHDLAVMNLVCDDIVVLREGQVLEQGPTHEILQSPRHPYTQALLAAVPGQARHLAIEN